ncbi:MAG: serine protease [Bdellovibrionota bacterium]
MFGPRIYSVLIGLVLLLDASCTFAAVETCSLVSIEVFKNVGEEQFTQRGVGWVLGEKANSASRLILTPAHVTWGSDQVIARCGTKKFELKEIAASITLDLALLRVVDTNHTLRPLFFADDSPKVPTLPVRPDDYIRKGTIPGAFIRVVRPGEELDSKPLLMGAGFWLVEQTVSNPLAPLTHFIDTFNGAIRPGYSGSAVFHANYEYNRIPVGMLTKVQNNSNESAAIPISDIVRVLPELLLGHDPWDVMSPNAPKIAYNFERVNERLVRKRKMLFGQSEISELCPSASYSLSTDWNSSGGEGDWGSGGGSDGWDELSQYLESSRSGSFLGSPASKFFSFFGHYFKSFRPCVESGLKLPNGRVLVGLGMPQKNLYTKITSIEDLWPYLKSESGLESLNTIGIFTQSEHPFSSICRPELLGSELKLKQTSASFWSAGNEIDLSDYIKLPSSKGSTTSVVKGVLGLGSISSFFSFFEKNGIECLLGQDRIQLFIDTQTLPEKMPPLKMKFEISRDDISGRIQIGHECDLQIEPTKKGFWSAFIDRPEIRALVSLSPSQNVYQVDVLHISPQCLEKDVG